MAIDKKIKKDILEDWLNAVPQLTAFSQNKLYKVVNPIVIGIELIKLPHSDEYRPHFVIYPLWEENVKKCFEFPIFLMEYKDKKNFQFDIFYEKHSDYFNDIIECVKEQSPLSFEGDLNLEKLIFLLDEYSKTPPLSASPYSYLQALLYEAKFKIALFIGITQAQNILDKINNINWDINHFRACGVDLKNWINDLEVIMSNRDLFLKQIELNRLDKKIMKLKYSEIVF